MNFERFNSNTERDFEKNNFERQKRKLTGYYLSNGNAEYIFNKDDPQYNDSQFTPEYEQAVVKNMAQGVDYSKIEYGLLNHIAGPDHFIGSDGVFSSLSHDKHQKRILTYMTGEEWDNYNNTSGVNVENFLKTYPTPMDFENDSTKFLEIIRQSNGEEKFQEYCDAMEDFQNNVYGKKYEYYKTMQEIHQEAKKYNLFQGDANGLKDVGRKSFEAFNRESLVKSVGARTLNKGGLTGEAGRKNEDSAYYNPDMGIFAVFDGAGGGGNDPARASELAVWVTDAMVKEKIPKTGNDLAEILTAANESIQYDPSAGISTAVIGKIRDDGDHKALVYASVGDSRIYLVRREETDAIQITQDEGEGKYIYNALGDGNLFKMKQVGEVPLQDGDRIVFCSDGITGDYAKDFIPNDEFASIVKSARTPDEAAIALINRATKIDDRTAVVVEV